MKTIKFTSQQGSAFAEDLKKGINQYFESGKSKYGDRLMAFKTVFVLLLYCLPIILLNTGLFTGVGTVFILYILSGFGMAGIGMNIMHDALHGSYSKRTKVNRIMGNTINLIGANASIWKIQHNVLHHTYTNVTDADDDLNAPIFLRFSPDKKRFWIHKFQYLYSWFFYGFMTVVWVTARDFVRIRKFKKLGFFSVKRKYRQEIGQALVLKAVYFIIVLVLPAIMLPLQWWVVGLAFLSMHFITGSIMSLVFQTAHVMPSSEFPKPDEDGMIGNHRLVHQLYTTCNYAPKSKLFSWCIGGLNYQIEHHLMPNICHVHYKGLSKMVKATALKHGLPYHSHKTFAGAIWSHLIMLRTLGKKDEMAFATANM